MATPKEKMMIAQLLMIKHMPFFGHLAYYLKAVQTDKLPAKLTLEGGTEADVYVHLPTAAVDGKHLFYNPDFIDKLTQKAVIYVYCHEILHCALVHVGKERAKHRNHGRWNAAIDYVVNGIIESQKSSYVERPACGALVDEKYFGWSAERVYDDLPTQECKKGGKGGGPGQGGPLDIHMTGAEGEEGSGNGQGDMETEWRIRILEAYNFAKSQGKLPGGLDGLLDQIRNPKINWKQKLRQFVDQFSKDDYSFVRPNRRFLWNKMILPSLRSESLGDIAVFVDTSGSISDEDLKQFFGEINDIKASFPMTLHVIQCDATVQDHTTYDQYTQIQTTDVKVHGRGGTSFKPPFEFVQKNNLVPKCAIYLTDGYGDFPEAPPEYPVLWISTSEGVNYPWGEVTHINTNA